MTLCPAWHALPWRHRPRGATCSPPVVTLAADEGVLPVLRVRHLQTLLTLCFCSELCPPIFASVGGSCQIALRGLCPAGSVISACLPRLLIVFSGRELAPLPSGSTQLLTWLRGCGAGLRSGASRAGLPGTCSGPVPSSCSVWVWFLSWKWTGAVPAACAPWKVWGHTSLHVPLS